MSMLGTKPETQRVAVSIVSYGSSAMVVEALPALRRELARLADHHVVIVDNASPEGDGLQLAEGVTALGLGPKVEVVLSPVNGGFAAGNNVAFAAIRRLGWRPDAVLLLNPDAEMRPGALIEMLRVMLAQPKAGFIGPRVANTDGVEWAGAFNFPTFMREVAAGLGVDALRRRFPTLIPDVDVPTRADWITGVATLIRWEAFEALGDMDDGYFLYYDETDYMFQGRRLGWESWHAPAAVIGHVGGATTGVVNNKARAGRQPDYWFQSWTRYFVKNHGPLYARATAFAKLAAMLVRRVHRRLRGKPDPQPERFLWDFARKAAFARLSPTPISPRAARLAPTDALEEHVGSDAYRTAAREMAIPPISRRGRANQNPPGIGFWPLVAEDFRTHDRNPFEQGFWAVFVNRFGNWRMGQPKVIRAPATMLYLVMFKLVELFGGISLWYTVKLGRRVRIWHHSGIVLSARAIGDDVHIRQNTTLGVRNRRDVGSIPIVCSGADIGAGACIVGAVVIGADARIAGNALVNSDVPPGATALGNPARIVGAERFSTPAPAQSLSGRGDMAAVSA